MARKGMQEEMDNGPIGQFAAVLTEILEDKKMSVMDLAKAIKTTYEHTRKVVRGLAFPSRYLLKDICKVLDLKEEDMWKLVVSDKIQFKYGGIPEELAGKSPRFTQIERLLPKISEEQFESVLGMLEGWARRNRN